MAKANKIKERNLSAFYAQSPLLPPRSMAGQQILDLLIGVRVPGGQPYTSKSSLTHTVAVALTLGAALLHEVVVCVPGLDGGVYRPELEMVAIVEFHRQ
jgi:hypothetical protein